MSRRSLTGFRDYAPFLTTFLQEGENAAYVPMGNGTNITVNAAQTKLLQWAYTPPVDVWAEFYIYAGLVQKTDANYHYALLSVICSPAPAVGLATGSGPLIMQHAAVQTFEGYQQTKLWGLAAGVAYTMRANWGTQGGTWQYNQSQDYLRCIGKAWAR